MNKEVNKFEYENCEIHVKEYNVKLKRRQIMINRTIIIVLDSLGIGELPDADKYGDIGANTLGHIYEMAKPKLSNMKNWGYIT